MNRIAAGSFVASMLAVLGMPLLGACDDSKSGYGDGYSNASAYCSQYASCGTCTPAVGCGWCSSGSGAGACEPGPEYCTGKQFSWTWEPNGCRATADASIEGDAAVHHDGADGEAGEAGQSDAGLTDANRASDAPAPNDAASE